MADVELGGVRFAIRRTRQQDAFVFENTDLRGKVDLRAPGGWTVAIIPRAIYLATHSIPDTLALALRIARGCGLVRAQRLRRFDEASDYVNFPLEQDVVNRLLTMRARWTGFAVDQKDADESFESLDETRLQEHRGHSLKVTGISVAPGNTLMARIYLKSQELLLPGREAKRDVEHARWRAAGWDGAQPVTRVEFQHRGAYLDEVSLRDPWALEGQLDPAWQSDTRWLRLIKPGTATRRSRCALDPRWEVVQGTVFSHQADPIRRSRSHRGGARPEHVLGSTLSLLASTGTLDSVGLEVADDGTILNEAAFRRMSQGDAIKWIRRAISLLSASGSRVIARDLELRGDPRAQALRLFIRIKAYLARFDTSDGMAEVDE